MLDYQTEVFLELVQDDALIIMAKGLGIEEIVLSLFKVYCDPGNLVVVIGTYTNEEQYFIQRLQEDGVKNLPKVITAEYSITDRQSLYLEGGVLFITSRILVVDLLTKRIPIESITGIVVFRAHKVLDFCQEAFILRLYREINKKGFIKAFSSSPVSFTQGFCQIERVMRNLFMKRLFLWPRYHATVAASLEQHKPETIEIRLNLTKAMLAIQTSLLDLITISVKELKRCNPSLDLEEVTAENAISKAFDKIVRHQLDHIWNQLSRKTKQLVQDLKQLRSILFNLTQYDCVTFFNIVENLKSSAKDVNSSSGWMFLSSAQSLFLHTNERIFGPSKIMKKLKTGEKSDGIDNNENLFSKPADKLPYEENPKWSAINEILKEIHEETSKGELPLDACHTLIVTSDDRTCDQIEQFLCGGGSRKLFVQLYKKFLVSKGIETKETKVVSNMKATASKKGTASNKGTDNGQKRETRSKMLTMTQLMRNGEVTDEGSDGNEMVSGMECLEAVNDQLVLVRSLQRDGYALGILKTIYEFKPRFIIVYDADMTFVRQIEVYKATNSDIPVVVYFLFYEGSAEEQLYLNVLRREKEAFEMLIRTKANMVIPEGQDGRSEGAGNVLLDRDCRKASETVNSTDSYNTRRGGGASEDQHSSVRQKIIVDMREFRSELPCLIHARGIDVEPVTLEVGDYILTPDICVERKSVEDLIGSLNSGRLYNQATAMCRYYEKPMLLIEFDLEKPFSLQGKYSSSNEISAHDFQSKLLLLTMHFPKLKILWCSSPYATAEIFKEIKAGKEQPSAAKAISIAERFSSEMGMEISKEKYNAAPKDFLLLLPGVDTKNCRTLMNNTGSLTELSNNWSQDQIKELLVNSTSSKLLWESIHKPLQQAGSSSERSNFRGKYTGKWKRP